MCINQWSSNLISAFSPSISTHHKKQKTAEIELKVEKMRSCIPRKEIAGKSMKWSSPYCVYVFCLFYSQISNSQIIAIHSMGGVMVVVRTKPIFLRKISHKNSREYTECEIIQETDCWFVMQYLHRKSAMIIFYTWYPS